MTTISKVSPLIVRETKASKYLELNLVEPTISELQTAVETLENQEDYKGRMKLDVFFCEEVSIQRDRRNRIKKDKIAIRFFTSSNRLCYTFSTRNGYQVRDFDFSKIIKLSLRVPKDKLGEEKESIAKILNRRFDEHTWSHLTPDSLSGNSTTVINIKRKFPIFVIDKLKDAFTNKTEYTYTRYGSKRDLRVSTKMGEDGVFRAWFSSEYAGCGNGQYYLLLNPTTASFCEWD